MYPSTAAAPSKDDPSVTGNMKTQTKTVRQPAKRKNIQAEDDATNETYGARRPAPRPLSRQSAPKRKKKFMSDDDENHPTGSILVTRKVLRPSFAVCTSDFSMNVAAQIVGIDGKCSCRTGQSNALGHGR
jgi:hypothetical protein